MKNCFLFLVGFALALSACTHEQDSLVGTWTVDKVNVQFDEQHNTPELVKQIGEMEKQNRISISNDSILVFKGLDGETQGRMTVDQQGVIYCDGQKFGIWKEGIVVTETPSPLGIIVITYRKE